MRVRIVEREWGRRSIAAGLLVAVALSTAAALGEEPVVKDGAPVSGADLAAYRRALANDEAAVPVDFRTLWEKADSGRGRRVRIEGRALRRFAEPAADELPGLTELWLGVEGNQVVCIVYPTPATGNVPLGAKVEFTGTYVRRIRYAGAAEARLAPLIVGAEPPRLIERGAASRSVREDWAGRWLACGLAAGAGVGVAWWHVRRESRIRDVEG